MLLCHTDLMQSKPSKLVVVNAAPKMLFVGFRLSCTPNLLARLNSAPSSCETLLEELLGLVGPGTKGFWKGSAHA